MDLLSIRRPSAVGQLTGSGSDAPADAAIERIMQRVGMLEELTEGQARDVAAIALAAMSVDDADRQRRDEAARENRRRMHRLGRD